MAWWTNCIEVIFEVGLQCHWVAVMLRCPNVKMVQCAELTYILIRSKVIHTVLKAKEDFCPAITMREYLSSPSSLKYLPFWRKKTHCLQCKRSRSSCHWKKDYARDTEGKNPITIQQLLPFHDLFLKFFSGPRNPSLHFTYACCYCCMQLSLGCIHEL